VTELPVILHIAIVKRPLPLKDRGPVSSLPLLGVRGAAPLWILSQLKTTVVLRPSPLNNDVRQSLVDDLELSEKD
jgi:hypothetical protein